MSELLKMKAGLGGSFLKECEEANEVDTEIISRVLRYCITSADTADCWDVVTETI